MERIAVDQPESELPDTTIETLARGFFKEASAYGFKKMDYVRFVNILLDSAMSNNHLSTDSPAPSRDIRRTSNPMQDVGASLILPLRSERLTIRSFQRETDRVFFQKWIDDQHGRYFLLSITSSRFLCVDDFIKNDRCILGTVTLHDTTPIGLVAYINHDRIQAKAELRKIVGESKARGRGFGKEATKLWIAYGQATLGLEKIYLNTLETNIMNIRLNEELGFRIEGILRNEVFFDRAHHDVLRMGLLRD